MGPTVNCLASVAVARSVEQIAVPVVCFESPVARSLCPTLDSIEVDSPYSVKFDSLAEIEDSQQEVAGLVLEAVVLAMVFDWAPAPLATSTASVDQELDSNQLGDGVLTCLHRLWLI